jgi:hypothetical protein
MSRRGKKTKRRSNKSSQAQRRHGPISKRIIVWIGVAVALVSAVIAVLTYLDGRRKEKAALELEIQQNLSEAESLIKGDDANLIIKAKDQNNSN